MNCGEAAGQTIMHFHCHLIPRYIGGEITERKWGFDSTMGKYGTIWLEQVNNENDIYRYINKYEMSKTLV
jgi:diadenosine tetraphosphate (Ap4A) HIT family hydrolase